MPDTEAIRQVIANAEKHQNDLEEFVALHTADALIVNIAGRRVLGRAAIREAMAQALATPLAKVLTKTEIVDIRFTTPDVALVSCVKQVFDEREESGGLPARGSLTYVVAREGDDWKIAFAQTTPVLS
ncbi:YybH family protein [Amycolatopsis magusensis]|uniref:YybH family protein n=1 Tax=Amycolatopsis magusensis TaxID=882444 RepID=UPI003C2DADC2